MQPSLKTNILIGHETLLNQFWQARRNGKLAQSWIFLGPKGVGKFTAAAHILRELLSESFIAQKQPEETAAGLFGAPEPSQPKPELSVHDPDHPLYRQIEGGSHPDVLIIQSGKDEQKKSETLGVEAIREIAGFFSTKSAQGGYKIVLIDDAERMNRNAANALLKILEEPPVNGMMFLIATSTARFPATIRSRCSVLQFRPLAMPAMQDYIRQNLLPGGKEDDIRLLSNLSEGCIGEAKDILAKDGIALFRKITEYISVIIQNPQNFPWPQLHLLGEGGKKESGFAALMTIKVLRSIVKGDMPETAAIAALQPLQYWMDIYDEAVSNASAQEHLYLDGQQGLLNLFARIAGLKVAA